MFFKYPRIRRLIRKLNLHLPSKIQDKIWNQLYPKDMCACDTVDKNNKLIHSGAW